jgi:hypothetical protein
MATTMNTTPTMGVMSSKRHDGGEQSAMTLNKISAPASPAPSM